MPRKTWIKLKRGLSEDPKHRVKMGVAVWLFLHMLDRADWETGMIHNWKDKDEADDMRLPLRLMRAWRQKLEGGEYIKCQQTLHGQDITIMKWVNPREYSGKVYNVPSLLPEQPSNEESHDDTKPAPLDGHDDTKTAPLEDHGDTHGDTHVSIKDVTPSLYSDSQITSKERDPHLDALCSQLSFDFGHNIHGWRRLEAVLKQASLERADGTVIIRGVGADNYELFQDMYARTFERHLVGILKEKVKVIFEA